WLERFGWPIIVSVAVGEGQAPHPVGIERCEDLSDPAAAVVNDQVNLIDPQGIEHLSEHVSVSGDGDVLIWFDLRIAMRQQVHRNAATDIRQSGQLVTPEMLVQHYTVDKQRHRAGARLGIADTARRGLNAADGQCGLLIAHGSVLLNCWSCERHICFSLSYI